MLFILAGFSLFYLNTKKGFQIKEQTLMKEKAQLLLSREYFLKAMTNPIEELMHNNNYRVEMVSTSEVKVFLNDNPLFQTIYVLRRN